MGGRTRDFALSDRLWQQVSDALSEWGTPRLAAKRPQTEEAANELCVTLLEMLRQTDDNAVFELVWEVSSPYLRALCSRLVMGRPYLLANELVVDTLASAFTHRHQFKPAGRGSFFRWLNIIAKNHVRMAQRSHDRRRRRELVHAVSEASRADDPLLVSLENEQRMQVERRQSRLTNQVIEHLESLPQKTQWCFRLKSQGATYAQIADRLGMTVGAVTMRIKRSRAVILERLAKEGLTMGELVVVEDALEERLHDKEARA